MTASSPLPAPQPTSALAAQPAPAAQPAAQPLPAGVYAERDPLNRDYAAPTIACALLFAIGLQLRFNAGVSIGDVLLIITGALWLLSYRLYTGAGPFLAWGLFTAAAGIGLAEYNSFNRHVDPSGMRDSTILMLGLLGGVSAVLWARTLVSSATIGIAFGFGMLVGAGLSPSTWGTNPWKYAFAAPVTVLVLGLTLKAKRPIFGLVPMFALAAISIVLDYRAYTATLALGGVLLIWRSLPKRASSRYGWLWTAALIAAAAGLVYDLITSLLVNGYLGADVQARSVAQIDTSGSLLLGGRPELAATWALLTHDPIGFGTGTIPTPQDVLTAKQGLQSINYDPNNGYVDRFLFGGHFELHSILGDVWANWGIPGLLLVAIIAALMVRQLAECVSRRRGDALVIYLCLWTLWNLMFSPLAPAVPVLILAIAFSLHPKDEPAASP